jgi:hypothetical protein
MVETAEAPGSTPAPADMIEAVIISGPRRGEIVQLPEDAIPEISEAEVKLLNAGLDQVEAALDRFEAAVETAIERFSAPPKGT